MPLSPQPLITQQQLTATIGRLAQVINRDYQGQSLVVVGVLTGSMMFLADLLRCLTIPAKRVEWVKLSSYGKQTQSSGKVNTVLTVPKGNLTGENVLVIEDIVDSGRSWQTLKATLQADNPRSLKICTLLDKPSRRVVPIQADYVGLEIPDEFLVGYGMDYDEQFRYLPEIYGWQPDRE